MPKPAHALALLCLVALLLPGCFGLGAPGRTQWAFSSTGLDAQQDRGLDGRGVRVAIIDTGLDPAHPALRDANVVAWRDVTDGKPDPYDPNGHGTHVASLVVGRGGLRGAAPAVELVAVKVFDDGERSTDDWVAAGIRFAVAQGADVIGLSLGGDSIPILGTAAEDAARDAVQAGIVVVAAAGNDGPDNADVRSPAKVADVVAVAACDRERRVADFSSRGASGGLLGGLGPARTAPDQKPEVCAPGVGIVGAWTDEDYVEASGTSSAVPFVVGALALAFQQHPGADPRDAQGVDAVKRALMESASEVPGAQRPHDRAAGYGYLDATALAQRLAAAA